MIHFYLLITYYCLPPTTYPFHVGSDLCTTPRHILARQRVHATILGVSGSRDHSILATALVHVTSPQPSSACAHSETSPLTYANRPAQIGARPCPIPNPLISYLYREESPLGYPSLIKLPPYGPYSRKRLHGVRVNTEWYGRKKSGCECSKCNIIILLKILVRIPAWAVRALIKIIEISNRTGI